MTATATSAFLKRLGERIAKLRADAGLTQQQLATNAEVTTKFVSEVERGKTNVSILVLRGMAIAMNVTLSQLFADLPQAAEDRPRRP